jgi:2-polyprenyl-3-methyl-5-hydroxy-6-metoxy-1,4-benzoquinol methylase
MRRTPTDFDEAFFQRYYGDAATRVADAGDAERLAALMGGVLDYIGVRVRRILDAGCGVGLLREPLLARYPRARYQGLEASPFLCRKFGWTQGSLADFRSARRYDLVVCHDVLQYLPEPEASRAIANLARLAGAALYFSALTRGDWRHAADQLRTDRDVQLRGANWYRSRLRRRFRHLGAGVFLVRPLQPILWELESPWR